MIGPAESHAYSFADDRDWSVGGPAEPAVKARTISDANLENRFFPSCEGRAGI